MVMEAHLSPQIRRVAHSLRITQELCRKARFGEIDIHSKLEEMEKIIEDSIYDLARVAEQIESYPK